MMPAVSSSSCIRELELRSHAQIRLAQPTVRRAAAQLGFAPTAQWQITLAMSEAAANMIEHGGGRGRLRVFALQGALVGLRFEARDWGAGIADVAHASRDHVSRGVDLSALEEPARRVSLGAGLGAIERSMDAWGWANLARGGLLWAEKYIDPVLTGWRARARDRGGENFAFRGRSPGRPGPRRAAASGS